LTFSKICNSIFSSKTDIIKLLWLKKMIKTLLNLDKLIDFAIRLEDLGEKFFLEWAEKTESPDLKKFFKFLAEEESVHKKTFEDLKKNMGLIQNKEVEIQDEYEDYFNTFATTILYNEKEMKSVKDLHGAIELAKKQEVDAQLFFSDLIKYLSSQHVNIVKQIIEEERNHFDSLSALEKKIFKNKNLEKKTG